ncbi:MAG: sigma-54 dependent transcriptional regulator [Candidatus Electryonea clarkiae]|nr:sigma-54 dependent transcriptional regulator [Candidatus Electryonea clarkiae]
MKNNTAITIGIIDDEKNIRRSLRMVLESEGYIVWEAADGEEAKRMVSDENTDGLLLDLMLPDCNGIDLLKDIRSIIPGLTVIIISGHGNLKDAVKAVKRGAYDFLEKPIERDRVLVTLRNALEASGLRKEIARLAVTGEMIGDSPQMDQVRNWIDRVAPTDGRILIHGESGTGKELVAREIHQKSKRAERPFVKVNCAAIPKELVESVLFGHVKGAFTGALRDKIGTFKQADGGTLFLDEIADMGQEAQAKVLRVLQEGEFESVGATKTEKVNVRVIAATHHDLKEEVEKEQFREDLYYRLAVLVLDLPPLREREGDVAVLTRHFFREFHKQGLPARTMSPTSLALMEQYTWPGNVRQLHNVVERLAILAVGPEVQKEDLPPEIFDQPVSTIVSSSKTSSLPPVGTALAEVRTQAEKTYLEAVLKYTQGNVSEAARLVGLERTHLHKKLSSLGIKRKG